MKPVLEHCSTRNVADRLQKQRAAFDVICAQKLKLDMTRGKPSAEQMDLAMPLLDNAAAVGYLSEDGIDCRNYGELVGIPEARKLFAELTGYPYEQTYVIGNSSVTLEAEVLRQALIKPLPNGHTPWFNLPKRKMLCPCPGYDRHFQMAEYLGFELIPIPMTEVGPDIDMIEKLVANDANIVAMWLVPVYSNPDSYTTSAAICERLAAMPTAAPDFILLWDMAYFMHHLYPEQIKHGIPNILELCQKHGNTNRAFVFHSTSKMTLAGGGIASIAADPANLEWFKAGYTQYSIGPYKLIQLQHVSYMKDKANTEAIMAKMAAIIRPKVEAMTGILERELGGEGVAHWELPHGGYFVSVHLLPHTAKRVVTLAAQAGVKITPAGSPFPYGCNPEDNYLRLSPTYPQLKEVKTATEVIALCIRIAALEVLELRQTGNEGA